MKHLLLPIVLAVASVAVHAESASSPVASPAGTAASARVVVQFKADATVIRARALAANATASTVAQVLGERASTLGGRVGVALRAGPAITARTQVVTAEGISSAELSAKLAADSAVEYAEPDQRARAMAVPNDTYYHSGPPVVGPAAGQWYLRAPDSLVTSGINAPAAWDISQGGAAGAGVIVAVLDTGVRSDHPDLAGKVLPGYDMVSNPRFAGDGDGLDSDAQDPGDYVTEAEAATAEFRDADCRVAVPSSWHGTQVAGIVGASTNNGVGVAGVGWNVRILPVRVLGKCGGDMSDIAMGIRWAAGLEVPGVPVNPNPARVINLSLGFQGACPSGSAYQAAISEAVSQKGVAVVVAAGNANGLAVSSPGNCKDVITVGAVRHMGTKVGFANVGPQVTVSAPGGNCVNLADGTPCLYPIMSTFNEGTTTPVLGSASYTDGLEHWALGTSFAAPIVSGTVGLMLAVQPALSPAQVTALLKQSARAFPTNVPSDDGSVIQQCQAPSSVRQIQCYCTTSTCGAGMLDAGAAVALAAAAPPDDGDGGDDGDDDDDGGGGGGGGALAPAWLILMALAAGALRRRPAR
ncbi:S8 family peptidase [Aquincola sp. MAHUQ-54]|uniref:S8 family peptidase n=1 Tax=Aquincola agrisoli TaxID=3119538 RepID=A0AAW9QI60_9BURK